MMNDISLFVIGSLLSLCGVLAVIVLNGIKGEIKEIKVSLGSLESDMREGVANLDRRMTRIEERCAHCRDHTQ